MSAIYPVTDAGTIDLLGDEFPSLHQRLKEPVKSPLMADIPGADTTNWSDAPRPTVTAWRGADLDAYHCDDGDGIWRHCQTGREWVPPVTLAQGTAFFCDMLMDKYAAPHSKGTGH
jgi:hypothetical protein